MEHSIFLAKIIGPYCVIVAAGILMNPKSYKDIVDGVLENAGVRYLGALMALIFGLLIINTHNVWTNSWVVIITILGWMGISKSIWLMCFPEAIKKFSEAYQKKTTLLRFQLFLTLCFGLYLTCKGYL